MAVGNKGYWPYTVVPGDVITNGKSHRVVRHASQDPKTGYTTGVTLAIKRCSWTGRGITCISYVDLKQRGFKPTGVKIPLDAQLDKLLAQDAALASNYIPCYVAKDMP